jgi:hypothetical protein
MIEALRTFRHWRLVAPLLLLGLAACGSDTPPPEGANRLVNYACADGSTVTALFGLDPSAMQLRIDGKSENLPLEPGATGAQYGDKGTTFSINGATAQLQRQGKPPTTCKIGV